MSPKFLEAIIRKQRLLDIEVKENSLGEIKIQCYLEQNYDCYLKNIEMQNLDHWKSIGRGE